MTNPVSRKIINQLPRGTLITLILQLQNCVIQPLGLPSRLKESNICRKYYYAAEHSANVNYV